jgi:hypothetical protein
MEEKKLKIYIASNVGIEYFFFLAKILSTQGYDIEPIFLISEFEYRSKSRKGLFSRLILRIKMYVLYPVKLLYTAFLSPANSIYIVTSNTFYAPLLLYIFVNQKKLKIIHLLYDLYPDAMEIAGLVNEKTLTSRIVGKVLSETLRKCDATVFLGSYLKYHAESRWGSCKKSYVIDISTDVSLFKSLYERAPITEKIVIHYGGQLGYMHAPEVLIEAIKFVYNSDIADYFEFVFYVSGVNAKLIMDKLSMYPIRFNSAVSSSDWRRDIEKFHIGLVSLSPGGATVCLPSKTYSMMAGGLAILAIAPRWSDLSNLICKNDCGWLVNNSIHENGISNASKNYISEVKKVRPVDDISFDFYLTLKRILDRSNEIEVKRKNAFNLMRSELCIETLGKDWGTLINQL